jgi:gliotoxin biosynthesis cytochrome P450 monooxygenase
MNRIVTAPNGIDLSTGHHLPHRTVVGFGHPFYPTSTVPEKHILRSPSQPPLTSFYPFRYSELRSVPGQNNHQFVTSDPNNINFGYGRNVCPGRFFASNEVKVILVELLLKYYVGLGSRGEGVKEGQIRPKIQEFGPNYMPDMKAKVWIKQRSNSV